MTDPSSGLSGDRAAEQRRGVVRASSITDLSCAPLRPAACAPYARPRQEGGEMTIDTSTRAATAPRILVIDDEPRILNFVARGPRDEGFSVEVTDQGADGLRRALAHRHDLVILDLLMPGLDGTAVLRGIMARKPNQAVIVLSAVTGTRSKVSALELGAEDYLAKPFAFDELVARVHARLRSASRTPPMHLSSR